MTTPTDQRKALEEAFRAIWPEPHFITDGPADWDVWVSHHSRFTAMLDAGAWLSAAEMLIPAGAGWWVEREVMGGNYHAGCGDERITTATTPALALLSAILAARNSHE